MKVEPEEIRGLVVLKLQWVFRSTTAMIFSAAQIVFKSSAFALLKLSQLKDIIIRLLVFGINFSRSWSQCRGPRPLLAW